jgi:hypothetical protein
MPFQPRGDSADSGTGYDDYGYTDTGFDGSYGGMPMPSWLEDDYASLGQYDQDRDGMWDYDLDGDGAADPAWGEWDGEDVEVWDDTEADFEFPPGPSTRDDFEFPPGPGSRRAAPAPQVIAQPVYVPMASPIVNPTPSYGAQQAQTVAFLNALTADYQRQKAMAMASGVGMLPGYTVGTPDAPISLLTE